MIFNWGINPQKYRFDFSNTVPRQVSATGTNAVKPMGTNVASLMPRPCEGTPSSNRFIDGSRIFVRQHYLDFFDPPRDPADPSATQADKTGWDYWTTPISNCGYNYACINAYRSNAVSRAFWESGDFQGRSDVQTSGLLTGNPAMPYDYRQFVRWCYKLYLRREPDSGGWDHWTSSLQSHGDYNQIINAFLSSGEYRERFPINDPFSTAF